MHWKLILQLSLLGLIMAVATISLIPSNIEPAFWFVVFLISAQQIASRAPEKPFLTGLLTGLANCVWVTATHAGFIVTYFANHAAEKEMLNSMPMPRSPRIMMALMAPVIGLVSGAIIGLFAMIACRFVKPATRESVAS